MKPTFFMLVGLPYSGKSAQAERIKSKYDAVVHSSDTIREEIMGDVQDQSNNAKVFDVLHRRVVSDLSAGRNVVYDATNINYKRRMDTLRRIEKTGCHKVCVFMATPFNICIERSKNRERIVPYEILDRMYKNMWIPHEYEGWDRIDLIYPEGFRPYSINDLFNGKNGLNFINQDNPHHKLTIGHHCITAFAMLSDASPELQEAALLHDIGKAFTKGFVNTKGETTEIAHYYNHHNVSAYNSLFYGDFDLNRLNVAAIIQWHMKPFEIKRLESPASAKKRFKKLIGNKMYKEVMTLHAADITARGT